MIKRVNFVAVLVLDQDRALAFYTEKLGMKVFTDQTMGDMRWIELQFPGPRPRSCCTRPARCRRNPCRRSR